MGVLAETNVQQHTAAGVCTKAVKKPIVKENKGSQQAETFRASDLVISHTKRPLARTPLEDIGFGTEFTDHLFTVEHVVGEGWGIPEIIPFGFLNVHPAAAVLHYGMSCFEGMKCYRGADGRGYLFRPEMNMARFHRSSRRLGLADFDTKELLECIKALLRQDESWLPDKPGYSLYLRPFMYASSFSLGIAPPSRTTITVVASPVGPYFPSGLKPVRLFLNEEYVRAWPGGVGNAKVASNYGPTIVLAVEAAAAHGTAQVLYSLPAASGNPDEATISEVGAMNFFVAIERADGSGLELVTPPLDGTILPGVTRDSILQLAHSWNEFQVAERPITIGEIKQAVRERRLREMFGAGTACIVQPVSALVRKDGHEFHTTAAEQPDGETLAQRVHRSLNDIYYCRVRTDWSVPI